MRTINKIYVHYSATYEDQNFGVADIRKMHLARGFNDVGYHYIVKRDGTVEKGRDLNTVGAHVKGDNTNSIGICGIGGINRATGPNKGVKNWTPVQEAAILKLIDELKVKFPSAEVLGHRDFKGAATDCPGFDVRPWYQRHIHAKAGEQQASEDLKSATIGDVRKIVQKAVEDIIAHINQKG